MTWGPRGGTDGRVEDAGVRPLLAATNPLTTRLSPLFLGRVSLLDRLSLRLGEPTVQLLDVLRI